MEGEVVADCGEVEEGGEVGRDAVVEEELYEGEFLEGEGEEEGGLGEGKRGGETGETGNNRGEGSGSEFRDPVEFSGVQKRRPR